MDSMTSEQDMTNAGYTGNFDLDSLIEACMASSNCIFECLHGLETTDGISIWSASVARGWEASTLASGNDRKEACRNLWMKLKTQV